MITHPTKSKSLFELFKERVIISVGDYFCCIHIFSAKLLISSQTFFNLKYIQKLEIYEFDVRLIFKPMCRGRIFHVLLTVQIKRRIGGRSNSSTTDTLLAFTQTKLSSIYRNKPIVTYTYLYWALMKREALLTIRGETQACNIIIFFNFSVARSSKAGGRWRKCLTRSCILQFVIRNYRDDSSWFWCALSVYRICLIIVCISRSHWRKLWSPETLLYPNISN